MKKALLRKRIWLIVGILTAVSIAAGVPLLVITALKAKYLLMAFLIARVAHGCYGVTFYFLAFASASADVKCLRAVEMGVLAYSDISSIVMLQPDAVRAHLGKCLSKGYIRGYMLGDLGLERIASAIDPEELPRCEYCGTVLEQGSSECSSCGAKK